MENFYKINTEAHYFVPLQSLHNYGFVSMVCSSDEPHLIECKLEPYHFSDFGYKLYAVAVDPALDGLVERRCFYASDFRSLVESGYIVEKTSEVMHVENIRFLEPIGGCAYLIHEGEIIVEG